MEPEPGALGDQIVEQGRGVGRRFGFAGREAEVFLVAKLIKFLQAVDEEERGRRFGCSWR